MTGGYGEKSKTNGGGYSRRDQTVPKEGRKERKNTRSIKHEKL